MNEIEMFRALESASSPDEIKKILDRIEQEYGERVRWDPIGGRENNIGTINISADAGRSIVERITNSMDAVLELECEKHHGIPSCKSPKDAAFAWLSTPKDGLHEMTQSDLDYLAEKIKIKLDRIDEMGRYNIEVADTGIGLSPEEFPETILSLNRNNKIQKYYVIGLYGQGGSTTFAMSDYTLISSRPQNSQIIGFTVVRYLYKPAEEFRVSTYAYLTIDGKIPNAPMPDDTRSPGTSAKHYGFRLGQYKGAFGATRSMYGILNRLLFDPVLPIWLDDKSVHGNRRLIKGCRAKLNQSIDTEDKTRSKVIHHTSNYNISIGDYGRIGIEYWVLEPSTKTNKQPSISFVNPSKPIILTLYGQNHLEMPQTIITNPRNAANLPYLRDRIIIHINCDHLTPDARRDFFTSTREDARHGTLYDAIREEIIQALTSDDELRRINDDAQAQSLKGSDEDSETKIKREITQLLGLSVDSTDKDRTRGIVSRVGGDIEESAQQSATRPSSSHSNLPPIEPHEPPTFIRIIWDRDTPISLYPGQSKPIRIETDAGSEYHDPNDPSRSQFNFISNTDSVIVKGSSPLHGGRLRVFIGAISESPIGDNGSIKVELRRLNLSTLSDERRLSIVNIPPTKTGRGSINVPNIKIIPVDEDNWENVGWAQWDHNSIAFESRPSDGRLDIFYSTLFPRYTQELSAVEQKHPKLVSQFKHRYELWIAMHSVLMHNGKEPRPSAQTDSTPKEIDIDELANREQNERRRFAIIASVIAAREAKDMHIVNENE